MSASFHLSIGRNLKKKIEMTQWITLHLHRSLILELVSYRHHGMLDQLYCSLKHRTNSHCCGSSFFVLQTKVFFVVLFCFVLPFCLASVRWNCHTSSGISMISEGGLFVLTVHRVAYYALPSDCTFLLGAIHIGRYPLSVCAGFEWSWYSLSLQFLHY